MKVIRFKLSQWDFITPINEIQEIVQGLTLYRLPLTKPWLLGACHLRGNIFPVTDLLTFITLKKRIEMKQHLLLFNQNDWLFGLAVSDIKGMIDIEINDINQTPDYPKELTRLSGCFGGITLYENESHYLFHPEKLINIPEFMLSFDANA
ncbi:hypothetical protein AwWohl_03850 [Gammaproteobacteria bacterium]|nr:hypothetical protein AwWohl_03850 [Gammaproteobacteria bacterium]